MSDAFEKLENTKHAFPFVCAWISDNKTNTFISSGMSLREHYAGLALQGIMANPHRWADIERRYLKGELTYEEASAANARKAVSLSDALIAVLEQTQGEGR